MLMPSSKVSIRPFSIRSRSKPPALSIPRSPGSPSPRRVKPLRSIVTLSAPTIRPAPEQSRSEASTTLAVSVSPQATWARTGAPPSAKRTGAARKKGRRYEGRVSKGPSPQPGTARLPIGNETLREFSPPAAPSGPARSPRRSPGPERRPIPRDWSRVVWACPAPVHEACLLQETERCGESQFVAETHETWE